MVDHGCFRRRGAVPWLLLAALCLPFSCNVPVLSPPVEATAGRDLQQDVSAIRQIATTMSANLETTVGQRSGRSSSGQIGLVNVAQQDVTSQIPTAGMGILAGLVWMKCRRAKRHAWSLTKAIRAVHDEFGRDTIPLIALRKSIESITRADGTEADNEAMVQRLRPRKNGKATT